MSCYVADGYWVDGYTVDDVCGIAPVAPRGDDAFRTSGQREAFWKRRSEEWLEDRLERIEEVALEPRKTRRKFAVNFLERAEALEVPRIDALAPLMAMLQAEVPDYTALAMEVAEWRARIAADRRARRDKRDIEALRALGEL